MTYWPAPDKELLIRWIMDAFRRSVIHYGFWFREVEHQFGLEFASRMEREAGDRSLDIQLKRLAKLFDFEIKNGVPAVLYEKSEDELAAILDGISANWLANDGVWFQAVENELGMFDAKRCNDSCWSRYSPLEASRIKALLDLPDNGGLKALKTALGYRLYARLNTQSITDETPTSFVFQMNECRVQSARKRKGLEDYPCKSAGVVEYRAFAQGVDPRIKTECIGCPPDSHPAEWFCAWRFSLE
jgi:hypothetical protein